MIYYVRFCVLLALADDVLSEKKAAAVIEPATVPAIMRRESPLSTGSAVQLTNAVPIRIEDEPMSQAEAAVVDSAQTSGTVMREGLFGTTPTTSVMSESAFTTSTIDLAAGKASHGAGTVETTVRKAALPYSSVVGGEGTTTSTPQLVREMAKVDHPLSALASTTAPFALPYDKFVAPSPAAGNATKAASVDIGSGARDDLFTHSPDRKTTDLTEYAGTDPITPPLGPQKDTSLGPLGTRDMLRAMKAPTLGDSIAAGSDIGIATPPLLTKEDEKTLLGEVRTIPIPTVIEEAETPARMLVPFSEKKAKDVEAREQEHSTIAPIPASTTPVVESVPKLLGMTGPQARSREVPPGNIEQFASLGMDATKNVAVQSSVPAPPVTSPLVTAPAPPPPLAPSVVVVPVVVGYPGGSASFGGFPTQSMQGAQTYTVAQQSMPSTIQGNQVAPQVASQMTSGSFNNPLPAPMPVQMFSTNAREQVSYAPVQAMAPTQMYMQPDPVVTMQERQMPQPFQDPVAITQMPQMPQSPQDTAAVMQMPQILQSPQDPYYAQTSLVAAPSALASLGTTAGVDEASTAPTALLQQTLKPGGLLKEVRRAPVQKHSSLQHTKNRDEESRPIPECCPEA